MTKHLLAWLLIAIAICLLFLWASEAYGVEKKVLLKCNEDSYVSQLSPDTNYGTGNELISQIKFTFDGVSRINFDDRIAYLHYTFPTELVGKVKVLRAQCFFYVNYYKGYSPYAENDAVYSAGLYPCLSEWSEYGITYNNQPTSSGPPFYENANFKHTFSQSDWNGFIIGDYGISKLQEFLDTGSSFGFAWYLDVSPSVSGTLAVGDYNHMMSIASRESGKMSYISVGVDVGTGYQANGCDINPSTLGEIKALYK
jgi:hypothetical protein